MVKWDIVRRSNDSCNKNRKSYSQKSNLIIDYRILAGSKAFQCIIRQKTFSLENGQKTHQEIHIIATNNIFITCQTHEVSHNGVKVFKSIT